MAKPPTPDNESERLDDLHSYEILDTDAESHFDDLVEIASRVCEAPIALVSLIDRDRTGRTFLGQPPRGG